MSQQTATHIEQVRRQYRYNTMQVLWLTGMSEQQFCELMYDTGLAWLRQYTGEDAELLNALLQDATVWGWWRNEWYKRDDERFLRGLYEMRPGVRMARYRALHQDVFIEHSTINMLLEDSYAVTIGKTFKKGGVAC